MELNVARATPSGLVKRTVLQIVKRTGLPQTISQRSQVLARLFASRNPYTGPEDHSLLVSINVLCLVIVGGMGSIPGVIVGALVLVGLPELLREFSEYRLLIYGALLVVMMLVKPEGFWPSEVRRRELQDDTEPAPAV